MPAKMIGTGRTAREGGLSHDGVHDYNGFCDIEPKCWAVNAADQVVPAYDPPPSHYATENGIQPWDVFDAFGLDKNTYLAFAVKYLLRAGKKDIAPYLDDLIKARNYINKAIEMEEKRDE
ncbi:DUF3310 domain-containing protein [Streptomyces hydrogenans]|uniref:DUF3310 domain-containing protein n=1 Tax=Streptomyces hydrogenans TaxID=1873719 RepID=A0ABQ3PJE8_9ACTN|nr:DUF3310 domain-containing protein [Streptomyces hydrogenans]GHF94575.1 hypothetical protein GCM10018784_02800 [Streptomyces hydrogenans]GHI25154.1 hypothetical protein Shyd_65250 [Streptomyces hydrogenans]